MTWLKQLFNSLVIISACDNLVEHSDRRSASMFLQCGDNLATNHHSDRPVSTRLSREDCDNLVSQLSDNLVENSSIFGL